MKVQATPARVSVQCINSIIILELNRLKLTSSRLVDVTKTRLNSKLQKRCIHLPMSRERSSQISISPGTSASSPTLASRVSMKWKLPASDRESSRRTQACKALAQGTRGEIYRRTRTCNTSWKKTPEGMLMPPSVPVKIITTGLRRSEALRRTRLQRC